MQKDELSSLKGIKGSYGSPVNAIVKGKLVAIELPQWAKDIINFRNDQYWKDHQAAQWTTERLSDYKPETIDKKYDTIDAALGQMTNEILACLKADELRSHIQQLIARIEEVYGKQILFEPPLTDLAQEVQTIHLLLTSLSKKL